MSKLPLAFALVMPLLHRHAPAGRGSRVAKRPRGPASLPSVRKSERLSAAAVTGRGRYMNNKSLIEREQSVKVETTIRPSPLPTTGPVAERARIRTFKRERVAAPDIEEAPLPAPSAALSREVTTRLYAFYHGGTAMRSNPKPLPRPLLDTFIATILSQATSNVNSSRAFANLKAAFPSWKEALAAGPIAVEGAIRCGGLAAQKAAVIIGVLSTLKQEREELSLEYLRDMPDKDVKNELCRFNGVGPKTAACVLMFGMARAEFPVDTHVRRIASRLGWMPLGANAETTYRVLNTCVPDEVKHSLHVLLVEHGRKICRSQRPKCCECPLADVCPAVGVTKVRPEEDV